MTVTLHFPDELEGVLQARAKAAGLSVERWLERLATGRVGPASVAHLQRTDPELWAEHLRSWLEAPRPQAAQISDEALIRAELYPDRS